MSVRMSCGFVDNFNHLTEIGYFSCSLSFLFYTKYLIIFRPVSFLNVLLKITYFRESCNVHVRFGSLPEDWNYRGQINEHMRLDFKSYLQYCQQTSALRKHENQVSNEDNFHMLVWYGEIRLLQDKWFSLGCIQYTQ